MKNVKLNLKKARKAGFSLVEMLVVIAIIGIIAAIAIPNIGNINDSARESTYQRNAQSVASVFNAGVAAGVDWAATDEEDAVSKVSAGNSPTAGPFAGNNFVVPLDNASSEDITAIAAYLTLDTANNTLTYAPPAAK